jgi:hypothetical protein
MALEVLITLIVIAVLLIIVLTVWKPAVKQDDSRGERRERPSPISKASSLGYRAGAVSRKASDAVIGKVAKSYIAGRANNDARAGLVRYEALAKLQALLDSGAISEVEFKAERQKLFPG